MHADFVSFLLVATKSVQIVHFALGRSNDNLLIFISLSKK